MRPGGGGFILGWGLVCLGSTMAGTGIELRLHGLALTGGFVWLLGAAAQVSAIARRRGLIVKY